MSFDTYSKFKFYGIYLPNGNGHLLFEDFKGFSSLTNMSNEDRKLPCHCEIYSERSICYDNSILQEVSLAAFIYTFYIHLTYTLTDLEQHAIV